MKKFFKILGAVMSYAAVFLAGALVLRKAQLKYPLDRIETEEDEE